MTTSHQNLYEFLLFGRGGVILIEKQLQGALPNGSTWDLDHIFARISHLWDSSLHLWDETLLSHLCLDLATLLCSPHQDGIRPARGGPSTQGAGAHAPTQILCFQKKYVFFRIVIEVYHISNRSSLKFCATVYFKGARNMLATNGYYVGLCIVTVYCQTLTKYSLV